MKIADKNQVLDNFRKGTINILVTTPVVEVGVDIPNTNIMLIESADRFGLASLHQLRGRIGRGNKKAYCLLFTESNSAVASKRLQALKGSNSGFRLAEIDLSLRGPGEVLGTKQHGDTNLKIASWQDIDLIKLSKIIALQAVANPSQFAKLHERFRQKLIAEN
jgi:ATP-dependent DNA helicase RecG